MALRDTSINNIGELLRQIKFPTMYGGGIDPRKTYLDIGAGGSVTAAWLSDMGAQAYAVDPLYDNTAALVAFFRRQADRLRLKGVDVGNSDVVVDYLERAIAKYPSRHIAANAEALPLKDGSVDFMFSTHTFFVVPQFSAEKGINESLRVLRHGGEFQIFPYRLEDAARYGPLVVQLRQSYPVEQLSTPYPSWQTLRIRKL